ncbi:carboxymuconolactone decarboxylase family protein [Glycomyces tenuis]|uniref:carboxymuconolactone decarboxylase family protein n=1 Tax=Glycomyces tenuis TaxID=58116 RepID=UPI0003F5ED47|nr:carboxymuconolactone decarboxylase family protein [Glycomyces tenuis]
MNSESIARLPSVPLPESALRRLRAVDRDPINLHRSLAHAPAMLAPMLDLIHAVRYESEVPRALRELLICRIAQLERSAYELAHHLPMALAAGVRQEQLDRLEHWREADCFTPVEQAVLGYAEHLGAGVERDDEALAAHFSPAEQAELTVAGAAYIAVARILRALDVEIDEHCS